MPTEFKLPALAENVDKVTVTKILVSVGDSIALDQPVIEIETDKAATEVPSTVAGTVTEIRAKEGGALRVGDVVFVAKDNGAAPAKAEAKKPEPIQEKTAPPAAPKPAAPEPKPVAAEKEVESDDLEERSDQPENIEPMPQRSRDGGLTHASPAVRRLAREIGVDVDEVSGTGAGGRITPDDVKAYARQVSADTRGGGVARRASIPAGAPLPEFERWGDVERTPMSSVRRKTAENMAASWITVPHVTQFDKADITEIEKLRKQYGKQVEAYGGKLTVTAILVRIVAGALKKYPQFNSSIDLENEEIVYKKFYNIGVAVDTDRGLLVPVVRDADKKSIAQIAADLAGMASRAREKKTKLEEMQGGTFTISNLGGIGGTSFTPIVNVPEVAILGVSRGSVEPVFVDGAFVPRTMLPLSLSYDHRVIDGADAARFLRFVAEALEQPLLLFLEG